MPWNLATAIVASTLAAGALGAVVNLSAKEASEPPGARSRRQERLDVAEDVDGICNVHVQSRAGRVAL